MPLPPGSSALPGRGSAADEFLVVVEGERLLLFEARVVGLPVLHEGLGLADLALPLVDGPGSDAALGAAEVPVEVGADLVTVLPGPAHLGDGVPDSLGVVEADVGAAGVVLRRVVELPLVLRQHVHAAEEVRHVRVVLLADLTEVREQLLAVLTSTVPREHHELRGFLTRRQTFGHGLLRLAAGERGGPVADEPEDTAGRGGGLGGPGDLLLRGGGLLRRPGPAAPTSPPEPEEHPATPAVSATATTPRATRPAAALLATAFFVSTFAAALLATLLVATLLVAAIIRPPLPCR